MDSQRRGLLKMAIRRLSIIIILVFMLPWFANRALPLLKPMGISMLHRLWVVLRFIIITTAISIGILSSSQKKPNVRDTKDDHEDCHLQDSMISRTDNIQNDTDDSHQYYAQMAWSARDGAECMSPRVHAIKLNETKGIKAHRASMSPYSAGDEKAPLVRSSSLNLFRSVNAIHQEDTTSKLKTRARSTERQRNVTKISATEASVSNSAITTHSHIRDQHVHHSHRSSKVTISRNTLTQVPRHKTTSDLTSNEEGLQQITALATMVHNLTTRQNSSGHRSASQLSDHKYEYEDRNNDSSQINNVVDDHYNDNFNGSNISDHHSLGGSDGSYDQPLPSNLESLSKDDALSGDNQFYAQLYNKKKPIKRGALIKRSESSRHPLTRASSDESVLLKASHIYNSKMKSALMPAVLGDKMHDEKVPLDKSPGTHTEKSAFLSRFKHSRSDVNLSRLSADPLSHLDPKHHGHKERQNFTSDPSMSPDMKDNYRLFRIEPPPLPTGLLAVRPAFRAMKPNIERKSNMSDNAASKSAHHLTGSQAVLSASVYKSTASLHHSHNDLIQSLVPWRLSNPINISTQTAKHSSYAMDDVDSEHEPSQTEGGQSAMAASASPGELNRKADEFIAKFNRQLVKQRQETWENTRG